LLAFTNPIKDGKLVPVEATLNARREAMMVAHAMEHGEVAVIVCGGGHDLTAAILEMEGGKCEYVRVAGPAYLKAMNLSAEFTVALFGDLGLASKRGVEAAANRCRSGTLALRS